VRGRTHTSVTVSLDHESTLPYFLIPSWIADQWEALPRAVQGVKGTEGTPVKQEAYA